MKVGLNYSKQELKKFPIHLSLGTSLTCITLIIACNTYLEGKFSGSLIS